MHDSFDWNKTVQYLANLSDFAFTQLQKSIGLLSAIYDSNLTGVEYTPSLDIIIRRCSSRGPFRLTPVIHVISSRFSLTLSSYTPVGLAREGSSTP